MGKIVYPSPLEGGFASEKDVKDPDNGTEQAWFQCFFETPPRNPLENGIAFAKHDLDKLLEPAEVIGLCFSKHIISNSLGAQRSTLVAAAIKRTEDVDNLDITKFFLGNLFFQEQDLLKERKDPPPTTWQTDLFNPELSSKYFCKKFSIDWPNYRKEPPAPVTLFLTATFYREKFQNLGGSTLIIFFPGYMNILATYTTGDSVLSAFEHWSANVENLVAFGADSNGKLLTGAIHPTERWPEKWPPYGGA